MKNIVWVPVAGTIAAIVAIMASHSEKEGTPYPLSIEAPAPRPAEPVKKREEPASDVRKFRMVVNEDGTFSATETLARNAGKQPLSHKTLDEFLEFAAPKGKPRPFVLLVPASNKVTNKTLLEVAQKLAERCEVKVDTSDSEKAPDKEEK